MKRITLALSGLALTFLAGVANAADIEAGRAVFEKFNCASCHGADAKTSVDPSYPILAGQHADYLKQALRAYQRGQANQSAGANARKNPVMGAFATQLSSRDIDDVSAWLETLPSDLGTRK